MIGWRDSRTDAASGANECGRFASTRYARTRAILPTGEKSPVIGLGTWQVFDVSDSANERGPLKDVLSRFVRLGGKGIDSSPMYGRAEGVIGDLTS